MLKEFSCQHQASTSRQEWEGCEVYLGYLSTSDDNYPQLLRAHTYAMNKSHEMGDGSCRGLL